MSLVSPGLGLVVWMLIVFSLLLFVLKKFAWKPILKSIKEREQKISSSLAMAKQTQEEMKQIKSDNEKLLAEARQEKEKVLKEADNMKSKIISEAKADAKAEADKIIENARKSIESEKRSAIKELKNQVAEYSIDIAEIILKKEMSDSNEQKEFVKSQIEKLNLN